MMLNRIFALLLVSLLVVAPTIAEASQASLSSPTTGTVSGLSLSNNFNNALDALNTGNSGATAPTNQLSGSPSLGNIWLNSTAPPYPWQIYDGAQYVVPFRIDPTNHEAIVQSGGGTNSIASATTTDLCSVPQFSLTITGTTTITSFGSTCPGGIQKIVTFAGALTLTYNASSMIIPGAANVTTSAGDSAIVMSLGGGDWQVASYTPASGQALINPAIDVGTYVMTAAVTVPSSKYLLAYGQAISRTTYSVLLGDITITQSVSRTNGSPTLTGFTDTTQIPAGAAVEGSGIPTGTTISSCTSTTCTMSANASSSGTANAQVFPYGNGDGSTTFNLPNCAGEMLAGRDNMSGAARGTLTAGHFGTNPDALGAAGGAQSYTLARSDLPNVAPTATFTGTQQTWTLNGFPALIQFGSQYSLNFNGAFSSGANQTVTVTPSGSVTVQSLNGNVAQTSTSTVPPATTANCMIRVLSMLEPPAIPPANDNLQWGGRGQVAILRRMA